MSQEIITVYERNGAKYDFDVRDADISEAFEKALEKMRETEKTLPKEGKGSVIIRAQCKMLKTFFDDLFGEGAGVAICTEKDNVSVCYSAYTDLLAVARTQKNDILDSKNTFSRYSNRKQFKPHGGKKHKKKK